MDHASLAFAGRQPIFDRDLGLYGYELLFRASEANFAPVGDGPGAVDSQTATRQLLLSAYFDIGIDQLVGGHHAFINFPREFLLEECPIPPDGIVIEVLEDVKIDESLVAACARLTEAGYTLALDDFEYHERWDPLIATAQIIKVDVAAFSREELHHQLAHLKGHDVTLLAEKVETREEFQELHDLGFDLFQGYFLAKPSVVSAKKVPVNRLAILDLLGKLSDPSVALEEIEELVRQDLSLSYKLLKYINSAAVGLGRKIDSISRAITLVGLNALRRWATMIVMASADNLPPALMQIALARAKMCERLADATRRPNADVYFTTGLLSALDAMIDVPMEELIDHLPLSTELQAALVNREGPYGEALRCALAYERCDWDAVEFSGLSEEAIQSAYAEASEWAFQQPLFGLS